MSSSATGLSRPSRSTHVAAPAQHRLNEIADSLHLFRRTILVPAVIHREIAKSGAADRPGGVDPQSVETGFRSQFSRIEELRSQRADVGMQPPGLLEKKPFVGRNGLLLAEDAIQRRQIDAVGMAPLRRLIELFSDRQPTRSYGPTVPRRARSRATSAPLRRQKVRLRLRTRPGAPIARPFQQPRTRQKEIAGGLHSL